MEGPRRKQPNRFPLKERVLAKTDAFIGRLLDKIAMRGDIRWQQEGFDIRSEVRARKGPSIEIAGPTLEGFSMLPADIQRVVDDQSLVSNIALPGQRERGRVSIGRVDFVANGRQLPLKDESVGIVLTSCAIRGDREGIIHEAERVLEAGGLLIWQGAFNEDYDYATERGFQLKAYELIDLPAYLHKELLRSVKDFSDLRTVMKLNVSEYERRKDMHHSRMTSGDGRFNFIFQKE